MARVERKRRETRSGSIPGWIAPVLALILGLVLGLVYAWVIDPVEYTSANPGELTEGAQQAWVQMVADSYALTEDAAEARRRLQFFDPVDLQSLLGAQLASARSAGDLSREQRLLQLATLLDAQPIETPSESAPPAAASSPVSTLLIACGVGLLGVVLFLGVAVLVTRMRQGQATRRRVSPSRVRADEEEFDAAQEGDTPLLTVDAEPPDEAQMVDAEEGTYEEEGYDVEDIFDAMDEMPDDGYQGARKVAFAEPKAEPAEYGPALAEFVTRYNFRDDGYDMSFPIETPQTEFLGECGVGISDVVNDDSPQQVTAFEVWLFDKDDIRTVTKVLLSDFAWEDEEIRSRLAPKGELVPVQEGATVDLETKSLRVRARIREAEYGKGGPGQNSYFERFVVELTAQQKL